MGLIRGSEPVREVDHGRLELITHHRRTKNLCIIIVMAYKPWGDMQKTLYSTIKGILRELSRWRSTLQECGDH